MKTNYASIFKQKILTENQDFLAVHIFKNPFSCPYFFCTSLSFQVPKLHLCLVAVGKRKPSSNQ